MKALACTPGSSMATSTPEFSGSPSSESNFAYTAEDASFTDFSAAEAAGATS